MMIDLLHSDPHWLIVALVSALLGLLIPGIVRIFQATVRRFGKPKEPVVGTWHSCFYNFDESKVRFTRYLWKVRKGVFCEYAVSSRCLDDPSVRYTGTMFHEGSTLVCVMKGKHHTETIFWRFPLPIVSSSKPLVGLYLSLDWQRNTVVGCEVLSRYELSQEDLDDLLKERVKQTPKMRLIRIKAE